MTLRPSTSRRPFHGLSLAEVMFAAVIIGAAMIPVLSMQKDRIRQSRTNQRVAAAMTLARDELEFLFEKRNQNGFDFLWSKMATATNTLTVTSGVSNLAGDADLNPPLDAKYCASGNVDSETFDRVVVLRKVNESIPVPPVAPFPQPTPTITPAALRMLEVTVTVLNEQDQVLRTPRNGAPFCQVVTYIGATR